MKMAARMAMQRKAIHHTRRHRRLRVLPCLVLAACLLLLGMGINFLISTNAAASNSGTIPMARVVVSRGDNLWDLVKEYNPGYKGDIREAIDQVQRINGIQGANIQPGDVLMIPVS